MHRARWDLPPKRWLPLHAGAERGATAAEAHACLLRSQRQQPGSTVSAVGGGPLAGGAGGRQGRALRAACAGSAPASYYFSSIFPLPDPSFCCPKPSVQLAPTPTTWLTDPPAPTPPRVQAICGGVAPSLQGGEPLSGHRVSGGPRARPSAPGKPPPLATAQPSWHPP